MARKAGPQGTSRPALTRQRALAAAVVVADLEGLDRLTMRRLAQALGVEAMSLYHHVANKDDILDGMVDVVFAEIELPAIDVDWKSAMQARSHSARSVLRSHPWSVSLMASRSAPGPATLRHHDAMLGCCRAAGFSVAMAAHALSLIDSYVHGFVLQEINLPFDADDDMREMVESILTQMSPDEHPHLTELTVEHVLQPGYDYGNEFTFGLDLILDGLVAAGRR